MIADILIGLNARGYQVRLRYAGMSMGRYGDTVAREHERMGGLAEYIPWVGIDDFPSFYADVDAVLNLHECGDPLHDRLAHFSKVFEAMALGVPAVINDFPSMTPMIEGAEAGVVVKEFTAEAFIEAISELIDDPKRLGRLRRNALRLAKERINWGVMEARLLAGYARLGARHEVGPEPARVDPVPDFGTPLREAEGAAIAGAGESKPERPVRGEA